MDYKDTINLPATAFPMKANLANREPELLKQWEESGLYDRIQAHTAQGQQASYSFDALNRLTGGSDQFGSLGPAGQAAVSSARNDGRSRAGDRAGRPRKLSRRRSRPAPCS